MYFSHLNLKRWLLWISDWCIVSSYPSILPGQPFPQAGHLSAVPQAEQLPEPRQKPSSGSYYYPPGRGKLLIPQRQRFFAHLFLPAEEREGGERGNFVMPYVFQNIYLICILKSTVIYSNWSWEWAHHKDHSW